ncbi:MAG: hypothetical protein KGI08_11110 [Thaumarchaeota archaeon]|nr:hypothetical protein [Nitrososphaerota archaeon]
MSGKEETELVPCEVCKSPTTKQLTKNGKFYCCTSEMDGHIKQTETQTQATSETKGKNISIGVSDTTTTTGT